MLTLLAAPACRDSKGDDTGDPPLPPACEPEVVVDGSEIVEDSSISGFACRADFLYPEECTDKVWGVKVFASTLSPGEDPEDLQIRSPNECDPAGGSRPALTLSTDTVGDDWIADVANTDFCDAITDSTVLVCNSATQAQADTWQVYLPAHSSEDCTEYGEITLLFYRDGGEECIGATDPPSAGCSGATEAEVLLAHRAWSDLDSDGEQHSRLIPILKSGPDFPERAWIRRVEVTDWGDAQALHLLKTGQYLRLDGDEVQSGPIETLDSQSSTRTFAVGVLHMGSTVVVDGVPDDEAFALPALKLDWSCEVDPQQPHFQVITPPQAYARRLKDLGITGVNLDHRVIMRINAPASIGVLELQGRHHDRISFPITSDGADWAFDFDDTALGVDAAGTVSPSGQHDKEIAFDRLIVGGVDLGTPSWVLQKFQE